MRTERLTVKENDYYLKKCGSIFDVTDKLGQLEDIEEELGIDLVIYHKLMEKLYCGVGDKLFVKSDEKIIEVGILEIDYCKKKIHFYKDKNHNADFTYRFCEYGKSFALTKEELEK